MGGGARAGHSRPITAARQSRSAGSPNRGPKANPQRPRHQRTQKVLLGQLAWIDHREARAAGFRPNPDPTRSKRSRLTGSQEAWEETPWREELLEGLYTPLAPAPWWFWACGWPAET